VLKTPDVEEGRAILSVADAMARENHVSFPLWRIWRSFQKVRILGKNSENPGQVRLAAHPIDDRLSRGAAD
jgi:hypothetical protein